MTDPKEQSYEEARDEAAHKFAKNWAKPSPEKAERDALSHAYATGSDWATARAKDEIDKYRSLFSQECSWREEKVFENKKLQSQLAKAESERDEHKLQREILEKNESSSILEVYKASQKLAAHIAAAKGLIKAIESYKDYQTWNDMPEHEVRHELCCQVPQIATDALAKYSELVGGGEK